MSDPGNQNPPGLAVVTGASRGLGRAFAEQLAAEGCDLVLVARNRADLDETAEALMSAHSVNVETISADLSNPASPRKVFERMETLGLTADTLINNAGFNVYGRFEDSDLDKEIEMIGLHIVATTLLTKFFLRRRDRGRKNRILNVSSIAGLVPGPSVSVHFATCAHLLSFSLALSDEFRGTDVDVTCLCPGPMATEFFARAGMTDVRLVSGWPIKSMAASDVASHGLAALVSGKKMIVPGIRNKFFAFAADAAPRTFRTHFARWIMART